MPVPIFYRSIFTLFDILAPTFGVYAHLFSPKDILDGFTPSATYPINTETDLLLITLAGWYACLIYLNIGILRQRPNDIALWKAISGGVLLVDLFMLGGFVKCLSREGRLDFGSWRGEDWGNVGGYAVISLVRLAFVAGLGVKDEEVVKPKKA